jgi:hypothetical protein
MLAISAGSIAFGEMALIRGARVQRKCPEFNEERRDCDSGVGTVEQAHVLERLAADLAGRLPTAVEAFVTDQQP